MLDSFFFLVLLPLFMQVKYRPYLKLSHNRTRHNSLGYFTATYL